MALPCSKNIICIIKNNVKAWQFFYCLNCLRSVRTKIKLESHEKVCENKDICGVLMPSEDTQVLEFNKYQKSDKTLLSFMQILNLWLKEQMHVRLILKNYPQQK